MKANGDFTQYVVVFNPLSKEVCQGKSRVIYFTVLVILKEPGSISRLVNTSREFIYMS